VTITAPIDGGLLDPAWAVQITDAVNELYAGALVRTGCSLRRVAAQSLPDNATTAISWDTEDVDTDSLWSSGTLITIPRAGLWNITAQVSLAGITSGRTFIEIVQTSLPGGPYWRASIGRDNEDTGAVSATLPVAAAESFLVNVYRDAASGTTMTARVDCYRVGA
jgi:hypothetical protein